MRTIKFRGKRCDNSEWVCGYYVECHHTWSRGHLHKSWIITSARSNGGFFALQGRYPVQDQTIGQFTGMHDKNGKEIYEGDILHYVEEKGKKEYHYYREVVFHGGAFCQIIPLSSRNSYKLFFDISIDRWDVAGNIHDNPELLKGGQE